MRKPTTSNRARALTLAIAALGAMAPPAFADSIRDYMLRAIDAGEVSGPIDDATAQAWKQHSGSSQPVMVRVVPIRDFPQEGCKRLSVVLSQEGVPTVEGPKIRASMPMELNLCRDGSPPVDGAVKQKIQSVVEAAGNRKWQ